MLLWNQLAEEYKPDVKIINLWTFVDYIVIN